MSFHSLSKQNQGRLLMFAAAFFWSLSGVIVKAPIFESFPKNELSIQLAFWRGLFITVLFFPTIRNARWHWVLIPMGLSFIGMSVCYLTALVWTTPATAIWLQNIAPVWVAIFSIFLFREKIRRYDYLPLSLCVAGVFFILWFQMQASGTGGSGFVASILGVSSGVFYAMTLCFMRYLRDFNSFWIVFVNSCMTAIVFFPIMLYLGRVPSISQLATIFVLSLTSFGLSYICVARALRRIPSHEGVIIALAEPILAPIWVYMFWRQTETWYTLVGGGIILIGLVMQCLPRTKKEMQ